VRFRALGWRDEAKTSVPTPDLPAALREFIARYVRSVEQLEILLLLRRNEAEVWSVQKVYECILSTLPSVQRWLDELAHNGLLDKISEPIAGYRYCADENLLSLAAMLAEFYRTSPVRVIEAIYKRDSSAPQSFADAFRIKKPDRNA
jgi:hypothetical protein